MKHCSMKSGFYVISHLNHVSLLPLCSFSFILFPSSLCFFFHVHLHIRCPLYVGMCIAVPLLVLGQLTHPHLPLLPILHVRHGPGGSAQCTAQWPKSEYLRNCQLSLIIRGSPWKRHALPTAASPRLCQPFRSIDVLLCWEEATTSVPVWGGQLFWNCPGGNGTKPKEDVDTAVDSCTHETHILPIWIHSEWV